MKALTIVGPTTGLVTGQSTVTLRAAQVLSQSRRTIIVNTNSEGLPRPRKVLRNIGAVFRILAARPRSDTLYISLHRSLAGSIKDLVAIAAFATGKPRRRIVAHLHGAEFDRFIASRSAIVRSFYLWLYGKIDTWIIVAPGMAYQLRQIKGARHEVLWNFSEAFLETGKTAERDGPTLRLLFLSNILREKGVLELCRAVIENPHTAEGHAIVLRVAGSPLDKSCADELRALAGQCPRLEYLGPVSGDRKAELLRWADAMVLPSAYRAEALPLCLIEGAAYCCHLISTRIGYIRDLAGILRITELPSGSSQDISRCLANLRMETVRSTGIENERLARSYFSADRFDRELLRIVNAAD